MVPIDELFRAAAPPCRECGEPVQRVEMRWTRSEDGDWTLGPVFAVCVDGHRVKVEPE